MLLIPSTAILRKSSKPNAPPGGAAVPLTGTGGSSAPSSSRPPWSHCTNPVGHFAPICCARTLLPRAACAKVYSCKKVPNKAWQQIEEDSHEAA